MRVRAKLNKADAAPTADEQTEAVNKLSDITVEEVSIVDRPANRRTFLVVKSARGTAAEPAAEKPAPMKISAEEKAKLTQKVQAASTAIDAMKTVLDTAEEAAGAGVPEELRATMEAVGKLLGKPEAKPEVKPAEGDVEKAGRKFSAANEAKLRDAQKLISDLLGEGAKDDEPDVPETAASATTKAAEPKPETKVEKNETAEAIASLTNVVSTLVTAVKAQKARIDELSTSTPGSRQVSKAAEGVDDEPETKTEEEFTWSMDMNRPHTRANTPVEKSFFES